jgi:NADPH:quinone reductase-like Zn-dependent oxidoreductase
LVQVRAASVNLLDAKIRDGEFKLILPYRVPFVLGNDMAGVVLRVGPAVRLFAPGDEVYARPGTDHIGTFAELAAVHEDDLALKPATLTMEESAALPLVALTAWQALVERANLQPGQNILVHAGSGGVGTIAIQLARHLGAHVATTTGTANTGWVENLGADVVVDYKRDDFEKVLRDYDVVLDSLGGQTLEKSLRVLRPGGIVIGIAGPPDPGFAREIGANPVVRLATVLLSGRTRVRARRRQGIKNVTRISNLDTIRALLTFQDPKQFLFFTRTPNGRQAGQEFLARLKERAQNRDKAISLRSYAAQLKAIHRWGLAQPADLSVIHQPVLVANGESDKMVPTKNSADLARRLPDSELVTYPDAGHGGIFQFHAQFVHKALEFLER